MTAEGLAPARAIAVPLGRRTIALPALIANAGGRASTRFLEFFTATIRNRNTRAAYALRENLLTFAGTNRPTPAKPKYLS
jgi:hypothetical protein